MSFRIDRLAIEDDREIVRISGRVAPENLELLRNVLNESRVVAIDLKNVLLIDREGVKRLVVARSKGSRAQKLHIREWVARARAQIELIETLLNQTTNNGGASRLCDGNLVSHDCFWEQCLAESFEERCHVIA